MNLPLTSIIIPCYNAEAWVGEAIESALGQTYRPFEVIVIDDGSTDESLEVIRSFGDAIRWEAGPNRGASAARNRGVELARGELIQFLDADDVLHRDKLARQVPFAIENKPAVTYCDYERCKRGESELVKIPYKDWRQPDPVVFIVRTSCMTTPAPLHWKAVLQEVGGFREDLRCSDDYELHMRLACRGFRFVRLPEILYTVRKTPGGLTSDRLRVVDSSLQARCSIMASLEAAGELTAIRRLAFAEMLAKTARKCFDRGLEEQGKRCFEEACQAHPAARIIVKHTCALEKLQAVCGLHVAERVLRSLAAFPVTARLLGRLVGVRSMMGGLVKSKGGRAARQGR